jgi:Fe-S cluster assembly iron-binding protein IscA
MGKKSMGDSFMLKGILNFSLILILSFLVSLAPVNAFEADARFTLTPFNKEISPRVDAFYKGNDKTAKPVKFVNLEASVDGESGEAITLEEDTDQEKKYSFLLPGIVTDAVQNLFNTEFLKGQKRIAVGLKSVDSIVGAFSDSVVEALKAQGVKVKKSVESIESIENVTLKFKTGRVGAVRTLRNPNVVTLKGDLVRVLNEEGLGAKANLARGRFTIKFTKDTAAD